METPTERFNRRMRQTQEKRGTPFVPQAEDAATQLFNEMTGSTTEQFTQHGPAPTEEAWAAASFQSFESSPTPAGGPPGSLVRETPIIRQATPEEMAPLRLGTPAAGPTPTRQAWEAAPIAQPTFTSPTTTFDPAGREQHMHAELMRYGYTPTQVQASVAEAGLGQASLEQQYRHMTGQFEETYGAMPSGTGMTPLMWSQAESAKRAREVGAYRLRPGEDKPPSYRWEEIDEKTGRTMLTRSGARSFYDVGQVMGSAIAIQGEQPGTIATPTTEGKIQKRGQLWGAHQRLEAYGPGGESLQRQAPFKTGPKSPAAEVGIGLTTAFPLSEIFVSGQGLLKHGAVSRVGTTKTKDLDIPEGAEIPEVGTTWQMSEGDMPSMFEGGAPLRLGKGWETAELTGAEATTEGKLRAQFALSSRTATATAYSKTGAAKVTTPEAAPGAMERITGRTDIQSLQFVKDPLGLAWHQMQSTSPEATAALMGVSVEDIRGKSFQELGREYTEAFRTRVLPRITEDIQYTLPVHKSQIEAGYFARDDDPEGWIAKKEAIEGTEDVFEVTTTPIPTVIMEDMFQTIGRDYPGRRPFLAYREMQKLRRAAPEEYERVMEESKGPRAAYGQLIGAAYATATGQEMEGAVTPTHEQLSSVIGAARARAMVGAGTEDASEITRQQMAYETMRAAKEEWGDAPIHMGEGQYLLGAGAAQYLSTEGQEEGTDVSKLGGAWYEALQAKLGEEEAPGVYKEAVGRARAVQAEIAGGRNVAKRAVGAFLGSRAQEGTFQSSTALAPHEVASSTENVLRQYGLTPGTERAEEFIAAWESGQVTPKMGLVSRPTAGDEPFGMALGVISPSERVRRKIELSEETPLVVSPQATQMHESDVDADRMLALALGRVQGRGSGMRIEGGADIADPSDITELAQQAVAHGAGELSSEFMSGAGTLEALQEKLDPSGFNVFDEARVQAGYKEDVAKREKIGPTYNVLEAGARAAHAAGDPEAIAAAEEQFATIHGIRQRPADLPAPAERAFEMMQSVNVATGGFRTAEGGAFAARGFEGVGQALVEQYLPLTTGKERMFEPSELSALITPEGKTREQMTGAIEQYGAAMATGKKGPVGEAAGRIAGIMGGMGRAGFLETTLGQMAMPRAHQRLERFAKKDPSELYSDKQRAYQPAAIERLRNLEEKDPAYIARLEELRAAQQDYTTMTSQHISGTEEAVVQRTEALMRTDPDLARTLLGGLTTPSVAAAAEAPAPGETAPAPAPVAPEQAAGVGQPEEPPFDWAQEPVGGGGAPPRGRPPVRAGAAAPPAGGGGGPEEPPFDWTQEPVGMGGGPTPTGGGVSPVPPSGPTDPTVARPPTAAAPSGMGFAPISSTDFRHAVEGFTRSIDPWREKIMPKIMRGEPLGRQEMAVTRKLDAWRKQMFRGTQRDDWEGRSDLAGALGTARAFGREEGGAGEVMRALGEADIQQTLQGLGEVTQKGERGPEQQQAFERFTLRLDKASEGLETLAKRSETLAEQQEKGIQLSKQEQQELKYGQLAARETLGALQGLEATQPGITGTPEMQALRQQALGIQEAGLTGRLGAAREAAEPMGLMDRAGGVMKGITSGWGMMRLRRLWGMTGGAAMKQIPLAAQEEQSAAQAAMVGVPMGQYQPGGMALNLMTHQAQRQNWQADVGRAAYGAYGWAQQGGLGGGTAALSGIGGPAIGAGLIGSQVAQWAGIKGAGAIGLGLGAGVAAIGATSYAAEAMSDKERMAIGSQGGGSWWDQLLSRAPKALEGRPGYAKAMLGKDLAFFGQDMSWAVEGERGDTEAYGQQLMTGELGDLSMAGRQASIQYAAEEATGPEGELSWMSTTDATKLGGQWMKYWGGENIKDIFEDPRFGQMAQRGLGPEQFAQMGQRWGVSPGQSQQLMDQTLSVSETQQMQNEYTLNQYQGFQQFGVEGMDIRNRGYAGGLQELSSQGRFDMGRMLGGSRYMWSEMGQELGQQDWQTVDPTSGMGIGTNWGGDILGGRMGQVGAPGEATQIQGGNVTFDIGGGANVSIGFNQWDIQDFAVQQQRGMADWQEGFQRQGLALTGSFTTGEDGPFAGRGQWQFQDEARDLSRAYQQQQFGFQGEQMGMQDRQFGQRWGIQWDRLGVQEQQWGEDAARGWERQQTQFQWGREDLAFKGAKSSLQFGWQMEDFEEADRFATGRQRRTIGRQRERATIQFGMGMNQLETQEERLETRAQWAEDDFNRSKERHDQAVGWRREELLLQKEHHDENMGLSKRRLKASKDYFDDTNELQDRQTKASREYWKLNHERQIESLDKGHEYRKLQEQIQDAQVALGRAMQLQTSEFAAQWESGGLVQKAWDDFFDYLQTKLDSASSDTGTYITPAAQWRSRTGGTIGGR